MKTPININAQRKWKSINKDIRYKIESNVWCSKCLDVVRITDYTVDILGEGLLLKGKCANCGGKVARVIEEA